MAMLMPSFAQRGNPRRLQVHGPCVQNFFVEMRVEVAGRNLEAGERLVAIVVSERQRGLLRFRAALGAEIVVHRHALPRARRRVVKREIAHRHHARRRHLPLPEIIREPVRTVAFLAIGLANARRESLRIFLAIPDVAQVQLIFARPEKLVRRWKHGNRSAAGLDHHEPVARSQCDGIFVGCAAEFVLLPAARDVLPGDSRRAGDAESAKTGAIVVRDRRLLRLGDGFLAQQVGPSINGELETAGEDSHLEAIERNFQTRAVGFHLAAGRAISGGGAAHFLFAARQIGIDSREAGDDQRRIPKHIPLVALNVFRRIDAQDAKPVNLCLSDAAQPGCDAEFRLQVTTEDDPCAASRADSKLADNR